MVCRVRFGGLCVLDLTHLFVLGCDVLYFSSLKGGGVSCIVTLHNHTAQWMVKPGHLPGLWNTILTVRKNG